MNLDQLETDIQSLVTEGEKSSFIYNLLLAYELPKASITRLKKGDYNLSRASGEVLWKKKLCFKHETENDLHVCIDRLKNDPDITKHRPRFIIVTDFKTLLALDTKTSDTLDTPILELAKHFDFFLPWAGMEKSQLQSENPADIKAAERMGRLYDLVLQNNPPETEADRHGLNVFLSRLLFCFFAEDTGIFEPNQFTNAVASHTAKDGSDLQAYLQKLFQVLSTKKRSDSPKFLQGFPYVNGGLFSREYPVPAFTTKSRKIIIECGELNWKAINPDIFGSMIQAVVHHGQRGNLGIHYTSVINIMKVIEPLFLDELYEELEQAGDSKKKLSKLLRRLYRLRFFDPACGSGNFLIIAYKNLCRLEIDIFKRMDGGQKSFQFESKIKLTQFYGIEIDDFAHETAKLSLWLAEHQMNLAFKEVFDTARPTLPLQDGGQIVRGNATRLDWESVCPKSVDADIYIFGNPPYLGGKYQSKEQKQDMAHAFEHVGNVGQLDYIACWFIKAARYIAGTTAQFCFVTTSSLCQGAQVHQLWPKVLGLNLRIRFAHKPFKWANNAKGNAQIICSIIAIANKADSPAYLFDAGTCHQVNTINPYLMAASDCVVFPRLQPISELPPIITGNSPYDGGNLLLSSEDRRKLLSAHPESSRFIRRVFGSNDFLNGRERWCLWIEDKDLDQARNIPEVNSRIERTAAFRREGGAVARGIANRPHQFRYTHCAMKSAIIIPRVSSERRKYIPIGFLKPDTVILDSAQALYDADPWILSVISSHIHTVWVRTLAGRLKSDFRYSSALCYNTFPFPEISDAQKAALEETVFRVIEEREANSEKTMSEMYDPDKMPRGLASAHHEMDLAIEHCYRSKPFKSDMQRLNYLLTRYEEMLQIENLPEAMDA